MKKLLSLFRKEMVRPIFYKCINKCSIVLAAVLLWDRFVNKGRLTVWDGCFIAAAILLGLAWLNYLDTQGLVPMAMAGFPACSGTGRTGSPAATPRPILWTLWTSTSPPLTNWMRMSSCSAASPPT